MQRASAALWPSAAGLCDPAQLQYHHTSLADVSKTLSWNIAQPGEATAGQCMVGSVE